MTLQPEPNDDSAFKEPYPPSFPPPLASGDAAVNVGGTGGAGLGTGSRVATLATLAAARCS